MIDLIAENLLEHRQNEPNPNLPDPQQALVQHVVGALAHHINSALMSAMLELEALYQLQNQPDCEHSARSIDRIQHCLERINRVLKTAQHLSEVHLVDYSGYAQILDLKLNAPSSSRSNDDDAKPNPRLDR